MSPEEDDERPTSEPRAEAFPPPPERTKSGDTSSLQISELDDAVCTVLHIGFYFREQPRGILPRRYNEPISRRWLEQRLRKLHDWHKETWDSFRLTPPGAKRDLSSSTFSAVLLDEMLSGLLNEYKEESLSEEHTIVQCMMAGDACGVQLSEDAIRRGLDGIKGTGVKTRDQVDKILSAAGLAAAGHNARSKARPAVDAIRGFGTLRPLRAFLESRSVVAALQYSLRLAGYSDTLHLARQLLVGHHVDLEPVHKPHSPFGPTLPCDDETHDYRPACPQGPATSISPRRPRAILTHRYNLDPEVGSPWEGRLFDLSSSPAPCAVVCYGPLSIDLTPIILDAIRLSGERAERVEPDLLNLDRFLTDIRERVSSGTAVVFLHPTTLSTRAEVDALLRVESELAGGVVGFARFASTEVRGSLDAVSLVQAAAPSPNPTKQDLEIIAVERAILASGKPYAVLAADEAKEPAHSLLEFAGLPWGNRAAGPAGGPRVQSLSPKADSTLPPF